MDFFDLLGYVLLLAVVGPVTLLVMLKVHPKDELEPARPDEELDREEAEADDDFDEDLDLLLPGERRRRKRGGGRRRRERERGARRARKGKRMKVPKPPPLIPPPSAAEGDEDGASAPQATPAAPPPATMPRSRRRAPAKVGDSMPRPQVGAAPFSPLAASNEAPAQMPPAPNLDDDEPARPRGVGLAAEVAPPAPAAAAAAEPAAPPAPPPPPEKPQPTPSQRAMTGVSPALEPRRFVAPEEGRADAIRARLAKMTPEERAARRARRRAGKTKT